MGENPAQFRYGIYGVKAHCATGIVFLGRRAVAKMYKSGYRLNTGCSNLRERRMHITRTQKIVFSFVLFAYKFDRLA